jgi:tRNA(Ile)-lysidine synthase
MQLLQQFLQYIKDENLFQKKDRLLLAVSGGVDSIVLCELCKLAGYDFSIAHCNFQLRDEESVEDEKFVTEIAKKYGVDFFIKKFNTKKYAAENKLSIQVAARALRYGWFNELINQSTAKPLNHLLTAHHADDNIETILMNFFKGSGINGLKGILPKQNNIVRPLLFATKAAILNFCTENHLAYREDSSNSNDKYTRNYFRNQLIPGLQQIFPQVKENLLHNAQRFRDINSIYAASIEQTKKKLQTIQGNEIHIPVLKLLKTTALHAVVYEMIKAYGYTAHQTEDVLKLLYSESGKRVQSQTHAILRNRKWLIISPLNAADTSFFVIEQDDDAILFSDKKLIITKKDKPDEIDADNHLAQLDAKQLKFPLILRRWKTGDYFYPLGMQKKKKLSRFFIDQKLSLLEKQQVWVLESNKKIIWIVDHRIDDRFKITKSTTAVIKFNLPSTK